MKAHVLIAVVLLSVGVARIHAATISVTTTNDSGPGSLRAALANAANGDTIDASSITGTIALTSGELLVTNSVDIVGPGPGLLALDGNAASRVFHISSNTVVSISSLTITNGFRVGGGGIYNDHSTLTVSNVVVSANFARGEGAEGGGGIYNNGSRFGSATLIVVNSIISSNLAYYGGGGGIYNNGRQGGRATLMVADSTLSGNFALISVSGGGIFNVGTEGIATLQIVNSTLSTNSAAHYGGGIENLSGYSGSATVEIVNSTLSGNSAYYGGGIDNYGERGFASVEIANSTLSGNSANEDGGGINNEVATLTLVNSTLSGNLAHDIFEDGSGGGGGIYNSGILQVLNSTMNGNSAANGGGIFNSEYFGPASLEIGNTILNAGVSGVNITNDSGTVTSLGYNLSSDDGGGFLTATGDQINTDPMLGPLQDNGGPTFTHALLCGSPAIDQGKNFSGSATDQRGAGFVCIFDDSSVPNATGGDGTDIGAFEVQQQRVCSPAEQINDLISLVQGLGLPSGTANSLIVKLQAAASAVGRGNNQAACGSLGAFLNEVNAQRGKKLAPSQADLLRAEAMRIRAVVGC